jgi:hypothetical protein
MLLILRWRDGTLLRGRCGAGVTARCALARETGFWCECTYFGLDLGFVLLLCWGWLLYVLYMYVPAYE